jgi:large conductance mechanosensitive channel
MCLCELFKFHKKCFILQIYRTFFEKLNFCKYICFINQNEKKIMSFISEFKDFAMRGNVLDMAVGIVIGTAFQKIVSSFVSDIIMPPIGVLIGGVDFSDLKATILKPEIVDGVQKAAVTINYGVFLKTIFDFLIIAFCIFVVVKGINSLKKKQAAAPAAAPAPTKEEVILTEIRDLLKSKK